MRLFKTRDRRIIQVARGQVKADVLAGNLQTIRLSLRTTMEHMVTTDLTPRETLILASILLEAYRGTLPQEEAYPEFPKKNGG